MNRGSKAMQTGFYEAIKREPVMGLRRVFLAMAVK
jgi:hypothetical protein